MPASSLLAPAQTPEEHWKQQLRTLPPLSILGLGKQVQGMWMNAFHLTEQPRPRSKLAGSADLFLTLDNQPSNYYKQVTGDIVLPYSRHAMFAVQTLSAAWIRRGAYTQQDAQTYETAIGDALTRLEELKLTWEQTRPLFIEMDEACRQLFANSIAHPANVSGYTGPLNAAYDEGRNLGNAAHRRIEQTPRWQQQDRATPRWQPQERAREPERAQSDYDRERAPRRPHETDSQDWQLRLPRKHCGSWALKGECNYPGGAGNCPNRTTHKCYLCNTNSSSHGSKGCPNRR
jgi:hypothetical protein